MKELLDAATTMAGSSIATYVAYAIQGGQVIDNDNYADLLKETYGTKATAIVGQYPLSDYSSAPSVLGTVWSDFRSEVGYKNNMRGPAPAACRFQRFGNLNSL